MSEPEVTGISNELRLTLSFRKCGNCRSYLRMNGRKDDACINTESPKYDIGISEHDRCPEFEERRK